ncbi:MAG TPA: hypothetical protein VLS25_05205, partial [Dehalococcoidia bacterium]|nr:hypothetical protein [Dehalococcoidia bacterium]
MRQALLAGSLLVVLAIAGGLSSSPAVAVAPANDDLASALEVAFQPYTNVQSNVGATLEAGENSAYNNCQGDFPFAGSMGHTLWYKYTHTGANTTLQVDTLGPDVMDAV